MLIRKSILEKIKSGETNLAFRKWRKPTVNEGSTLKTAVGILAIEGVEKISEPDISETDVRRAGFSDKAALFKELGKREGDIYRITLRYAGADPRIRLREDGDLSRADFEKLRQKLQRLDSASRAGAWTFQILTAIERHPNLPAVELAGKTGFEKEWLKQNIRKLKNFGLTISHHPGYTLSPRGEAYLTILKENER